MLISGLIRFYVEDNLKGENNRWWEERVFRMGECIKEYLQESQIKHFENSSFELFLKLNCFTTLLLESHIIQQDRDMAEFLLLPEERFEMRRIVFLDEGFGIMGIGLQKNNFTVVRDADPNISFAPQIWSEGEAPIMPDMVRIQDFVIVSYNHLFSIGIPKNITELNLMPKRLRQV